MSAFELCKEVSTNCVYYAGEASTTYDVANGEGLTSVLQKIMSLNTPSTTVTTNDSNFVEIVCGGLPKCLVGVTYLPVDWTLSDSLGFSYDLSGFVNSLGTDFSLVRSRVDVYSTQNIFNSSNLQGGFTATAEQLPAFVDIDIVMNSLCGLIKFSANFVITCNSTGTFQANVVAKGGGDITITSQGEFNNFIKADVEGLKNTVNTYLSPCQLPTSDLYPTNTMSQKSLIYVLADTIIKQDDRLKELENVKGCSNECATCPGGESDKLQDIINNLCTLISNQQDTINELTTRVAQLEANQ